MSKNFLTYFVKIKFNRSRTYRTHGIAGEPAYPDVGTKPDDSRTVQPSDIRRDRKPRISVVVIIIYNLFRDLGEETLGNFTLIDMLHQNLKRVDNVR